MRHVQRLRISRNGTPSSVRNAAIWRPVIGVRISQLIPLSVRSNTPSNPLEGVAAVGAPGKFGTGPVPGTKVLDGGYPAWINSCVVSVSTEPVSPLPSSTS